MGVCTSGVSKTLHKIAVYVSRLLWKQDPSAHPLVGDRCIEYAFVVKHLATLDRTQYHTVLDIGCFPSPLTTIMRELGFTVDGIDLHPAPYHYDGVRWIQANILALDPQATYDVVVSCSTIEHIGLERRFGSPKIERGDLLTLRKVRQLLRPGGVLLLTIPYGKAMTIAPFHRVYNTASPLLQYAYAHFHVTDERFYTKDEDNKWIRCQEREARNVTPTETSYALGLFAFRSSSSPS